MDKSRCLTSIPNEIIEHLETFNSDKYDGLHWIDILGNINNEPCIRMFVYKWSKKKGLQIKEAGREFLDKAYLSDDLYYSRIAGYQMVFDGDVKRGYYYHIEPTGTFNETSNCWFPKVMRERLYNARDLQVMFKDYVPYLSISNLTEVENVMDVLRKYKSSHMCEMLTKAGFPYLCKWEKGIARLTKQNQKKVVKWIIDNKSYMYSHTPTYQFIMMAIKHNENGEQCRYRCLTENHRKYLANGGFEYSYDEVETIVKYLERQGCDITIYRDYLQMSLDIGRNIEDHGVRFPRDLMVQHDRLQEGIDKKKNRRVNCILKKIKPQLDKYAISYRGLQIVIPKSQHELVQWGNKLHNCVGVMGYGKKMITGDCIILGVYKDGEPVECCEIIKDKSSKLLVNQLRGDHNQPSEYHKIAEKLIGKFLKAYKPMNLIGGCI